MGFGCVVICIIVTIILVLILSDKSKSNYDGVTPLFDMDIRPPLGDYLPTVGEVGTGEGGYVDEASLGDDDNMECQFCKDTCINATLNLPAYRKSIYNNRLVSTFAPVEYIKAECDRKCQRYGSCLA